MIRHHFCRLQSIEGGTQMTWSESKGDLPILYSSLKARQRASNKAVFPEPTGLVVSIFAHVPTDITVEVPSGERADVPSNANCESPICPISSRIVW